jgi:hypothetical protein
MFAVLIPAQVRSSVLDRTGIQVRADGCFRSSETILRPGPGSCVVARGPRSGECLPAGQGHGFELVTNLVTARLDVAGCLVVGAPAAVTTYGQVPPAPQDGGLTSDHGQRGEDRPPSYAHSR